MMEIIQTHNFNSRLPSALLSLLQEEDALAESYVVGGFVRDALLRETRSKDFDVEVFGVSWPQLSAALSRWGRVDQVGKSFGTIKLSMPGCAAIDFALPREDSKTSPGHRGFSVRCRPEMTLREASVRRDFTVNALFYDPRQQRVIDCVGGLKDLSQKRLRTVSPNAFAEDPLRVLRAIQFLSRFDFRPDPELIRLSRKMSPGFAELAKERICEEWLKWASKSHRPSVGLRFLLQSGWIQHFPELQAIVGVPQDPEWHPEGDVFRHTCHCCDALAALEDWRQKPDADRAAYMLAVLLHDLGKASTTAKVLREGKQRIVAPGHERIGVSLAESFLQRLGASNALCARVKPLVANHMIRLHEPTDRAVRRLAHRLQPETIEGLCLVMTADSFGRPPKPKILPESIRQLQIRASALRLRQSAPQKILQGRDLLRLGVPPGPAMGKILAQAFEAQLDGQVTNLESAISWARSKKLIP